MELNLLNIIGMTAWGRSLRTQEKKNLEAFGHMISKAEGVDEYHPLVKKAGSNGWDIIQGYKKLDTFRRGHPEGCNATGKAIGRFQIEGSTWCDLAPQECKNNLDPVCQTSTYFNILKRSTNYQTCKHVTVNGKRVRRCTTMKRTVISAYDDILAGRFVDAMKKLNGRYSSMPESSAPTNDPLLKGGYAAKVKFIQDHGGVYVKGLLG